MFPTKYPIIGNIFSSFHSVVTGENDIHLKWTDFIPSFLKKRVFEGIADYSYLKIDGQIYTVVQAIWQNDIYNHKEYKKLIDQFEELQRWKEQQLVKITTDLEKKRIAFKQAYDNQFSQDDVENIKRKFTYVGHKYSQFGFTVHTRRPCVGVVMRSVSTPVRNLMRIILCFLLFFLLLNHGG